MAIEEPNPYAVPVNSDTAVVDDEAFRRPIAAWWTAVTHVAGYGLLLTFGILGLLVISFDGLAGARLDEMLMVVLAVLVAPVAGWLMLAEFRGLRSPTVLHERQLSTAAKLTTFALAIMSGFWSAEYMAFGYFFVNAVPGIAIAACSFGWFGAAVYRHRSVTLQTLHANVSVGHAAGRSAALGGVNE